MRPSAYHRDLGLIVGSLVAIAVLLAAPLGTGSRLATATLTFAAVSLAVAHGLARRRRSVVVRDDAPREGR